MNLSLQDLNASGADDFITELGDVFENSPWIVSRTWHRRPFPNVEALHAALSETMRSATPAEQLALIRAHPDLVGRAARDGTLTAASRSEQLAAGLGGLSSEEVALFDRYNTTYHERFGFPFVICARENKKESILAAFPPRLAHNRGQEVGAALEEISKIAWFRVLAKLNEPARPPPSS